MKKKILALLIVTLMLAALAPQMALAASYQSLPVENGQTLNLSTGEVTWTESGLLVKTYDFSDYYWIEVSDYAAVVFTGSGGKDIVCGTGTAVTLDNVTNHADSCALGFTGVSNTLTLVGTNDLVGSVIVEGSSNVGETAALVITGDGSLEVKGSNSGSGIGSGVDWSGGNITITGDVDVTATGGIGAAGIGGGNGGGSGTITISGNACVTATGGASFSDTALGIFIGGGAGIGGGWLSRGKNITISGNACVTAVGGQGSAGIGGGYGGSGGTINILGGTVKATGGAGVQFGSNYFSGGSGIGGGGGTEWEEYEGGAGTITISGGTVYATRGSDGACDIGRGESGSGGTINISGTAAVLLGTDTIDPSPATPEHTHYEFTEDTDEVYGIAVPTEWEPEFGAYLVLCDLDYHANGGSGTTPSAVTDRLIGTSVTVASGSGLELEGHVFNGWNTAADGSGTFYLPGEAFTFTKDTTLYAQWTSLYVLQYNANGGSGTPPPTQTERTDSGVTATVVRNGKGLSYAGHAFSGWNTKADGTGKSYDPGDDFTYTGVTTLYAQWEAPVTSVNIITSSKTLSLNETADLTVTVSPGDATDADVTWTSSDESIVTVDGTGKVTAVGYGSATVTAEADGKFDTCTITVAKTNVTGVTLSSTSKKMGIGDTVTLSATVSPSDATDAGVTWTSTNPSVATVDARGKVTAVAEGATSIIVKAGTAFNICTVLVSSGLDASNGSDEDDTPPSFTPSASSESADKNEDEPDMVIITIVVSELPEGAAAVRLPNGEVVELDGSDTMDIEIDAAYVDDDGSVELTALDEEGMPLGGTVVAIPDTGGVWPVLLWVLIGIAGVGAVALAVYVVSKKRRA